MWHNKGRTCRNKVFPEIINDSLGKRKTTFEYNSLPIYFHSP